MAPYTPAHISVQLLRINCPRCGHEFAVASHTLYRVTVPGDKKIDCSVSDILCASDTCEYFKVGFSDEKPSIAMKRVLNFYLQDYTDDQHKTKLFEDG